MTIDPKILIGQTDKHLVGFGNEGHRIHSDLEKPLSELCQAAKAGGFEIAVASSYRSFDSHLKIWNAKARGERTLLDSA